MNTPPSSPALLDPVEVAAQLIGAPAAPPPPAAPVTDQAAATAGRVTPTPDGMIDRKGRVFDPARHYLGSDGKPVVNRRTGCFMPKPTGSARPGPAPVPSEPAPGRSAPVDAGKLPGNSGLGSVVSGPAPVGSAPVASGESGPAPVGSLATPAPAGPAWSEAERAAAAKPMPEAGKPEAEAGPAAPLVDYSGDAGKAISRGVYVLAGYVFDARDEVTPPKAEDVHLCEATAAWIRSTGWRGGPLAGALLAWLAYFLGIAEKPKVSAKLAKWFGSKKQAEPIDVKATPVPVSAPVPVPAKPVPSGPVVGFAGLRQN